MIDIPRTVHESECEILARMLLNLDAYRTCCARLTATDFSDRFHQKVFELLKEAGEKGEPETRMLTMAKAVQKSPFAKEVNRIGKIMSEYGHWAKNNHHLDYHLRVVVESAQRRRVADMGQACLDASQNESTDYREVISTLSNEILDRTVGTSERVFVGDTIFDTIDEIERAKVKPPLISTGLRILDDRMGGMGPGEVCTIAGMIGGGKTSLALHLCMYAAKHGKSIGYFSLEMSARDLQKRMIANLAAVNLSVLFTGRFTREEGQRIAHASNLVNQWKFAIFDRNKRLTVKHLRDIVMSHKKQYGLDYAVVDNLQLLTPLNPKDSREQQVSVFSRECKLIAGETGVTVIPLAQLNREASKSNIGPKKEHLRESSDIAANSDVILIVYERPAAEGEAVPNGWTPMTIRVDKQRRGPEVEVPVIWNKAFQQWDDPQFSAVEWEF